MKSVKEEAPQCPILVEIYEIGKRGGLSVTDVGWTP
jgi:hypothetical protein